MKMWIVLAFAGALSQALGMAIKKYALQTPDLNNCIGCLSYGIAGAVLWIWYSLDVEGYVKIYNISLQCWFAIACFAGGNLIAMWCMYKALDSTEFSYLMPFMSVTSLSIIIPPMVFLGEIPSRMSLVGIACIVIGAYYMNYRRHTSEALSDDERHQKASNKKAMLYFIVIALLYTFTPTAAKIAIQESSVSFTTFIVHVLMSLGFFVLVIISNESSKLIAIFRNKQSFPWIGAVCMAGILSAVENGSINSALHDAPIAYIFAIKRTMPLFAFAIGYVYFKERAKLRQKICATVCMVIGSIVTVLA